MTWATITSSGHGRVIGYRLMIEGWPDVWVSDKRITFSGNADGRNVYAGLRTQGLEFSERLNFRDCMTEASGFTARIVSTTNADEATASLSRDVSPAAFLGGDLTAAATTMTLQSGGSLSNNTVYHLGTEAIRVGTWNAITRTIWDTQKQAHNTTLLNGDRNTVPIYTNPPTMEGRRCILYVYGEGDTLTGDGTVLFRGIVTRPPTLDSDGVTWLIHVGSRHELLKQNVSSTEVQMGIYGIYHTQETPFYLKVNYNGAVSSAYYVTGVYGTLAELLVAINDKFDSALSELSATNIKYIRMRSDADGFYIELKIGASAADVTVFCGSMMMGWVRDATRWYNDAGNSVLFSDLLASTVYHVAFDMLPGVTGTFPENGFTVPMAPLGIPADITPPTKITGDLTSDPSSTDSPWTVYVDQNFGDLTGYFVHISGTRKPGGMYEVSDGSVSGQLEIAPVWEKHIGGFMGYLDGDTKISVLQDYGTGDVTDFITSVTTNATTSANDGIAPFLSDDTLGTGDIATWGVSDAVSLYTGLSVRDYRFVKPKSLRDVLAEELKLIGHILYLDSSGRMDIRPLPAVSQQMLSSNAITATEILTPYGSGGAWPKWEPQRDGLINQVEIQEDYDPVEDKHTGELFVVKIEASIAEHKTRGKGKIDIKPYSSSVGDLTPEEATYAAKILTNFFGRDYATVTVRVPLTMFSLLIGDVVKFTSAHVPNGTGGRGVTSKRGIVVGRKWGLDPAENDPGKITLMFQRGDEGGYTPAGIVTSQSGSGTAWTVTLGSSHQLNQSWSQSADGVVAEHFAAGDYIQLIALGDAGETTVTGTVDSVSGDDVAVSLDATWTPGSDTWLFGWPKDSGSNATSHQQAFTYVGDTTYLLTTSSPARRFL